MSIVRSALIACALISAALLSAGCMQSKYTTGKPIPQDKVDMIVDGQTTSEQILVWFGAPTQQNTLGENLLYVYKYCENEGSGLALGYYAKMDSQENCDELTITFDKVTGRVKAHGIHRAKKE